INIYMNEFDQFIKQTLKLKYYIRYADDFVIFNEDKQYLINLIPQIQEFLGKYLKLSLNPNKVSIRTLESGIDFLGWVHFPDHRILRTTSKKRMFKKLKENPSLETINSYLGLLKHGNTEKLLKIF
ncbi:MAG: RNA-directed DNA polymerase, partial [Microgenomates group bacterium Gr01-1014_93]